MNFKDSGELKKFLESSPLRGDTILVTKQGHHCEGEEGYVTYIARTNNIYVKFPKWKTTVLIRPGEYQIIKRGSDENCS